MHTQIFNILQGYELCKSCLPPHWQNKSDLFEIPFTNLKNTLKIKITLYQF